MAVHENERVYAMLGTREGGPVSKREVLAMGGILLFDFENDFHANPAQMISYRALVIHGDSTWSAKNEGGRFSDETIALLQKLEPGDRLVIADIQARDDFRASISVRPAEFVIQ